MNDDANNIPKFEKANYDWILMKCLLEAQQETMRAMEQHTLSAMTQHGELSNRELETSLEQARRSHKRAIEDIDAALSTLCEDSQPDDSQNISNA